MFCFTEKNGLLETIEKIGLLETIEKIGLLETIEKIGLLETMEKIGIPKLHLFKCWKVIIYCPSSNWNDNQIWTNVF